MNENLQAALTQPVRRMKRDGMEFLLHTETELETLRNMAHLKPVVDYAEKWTGEAGKLQSGHRIIFVSKKSGICRQAALAFMSLYRHFSGAAAKKKEETAIYERFTAMFTCLSEDEEEEEKQEMHGQLDCVHWESDFLVMTPGELSQDCKEQAEGAAVIQMDMKEMRREERKEQIRKQAKNIYLDGFQERLSDGLVDETESLDHEIIVIAVPENEENRYFLKRFAFEQGISVISIGEPAQSYYENLMREYIQRSGGQLNAGVSLRALLWKLKSYRGALFEEQDIFRFVDAALEQTQEKEMSEEQFHLYGEEKEISGLEELKELIGLAEVKKTIQGMYIMQYLQAEGCMEGQQHRNLAFEGPPGTGKTEVAKLYGKILAQIGVSNGRFVAAARKDLIGKYLGHTAANVAAVFQRAQGGVLFIDEAGFLTAKDDFTRECVTELVRFMEEQPQTTVIFATYPEEIEQLLGADPGFSSRIRKIVRFEAYSEEELWKIFCFMVKKAGFSIEKGAWSTVMESIQRFRSAKGTQFGNAREMRRLMEASVEKCCIRQMEQIQEKKKRQPDYIWSERVITAEDVSAALQELLPPEPVRRLIGFGRCCEGTGGISC